MKCQNCGQEMHFGQEQCGMDITGNPIYKDFAYCDNCKIKVEIQQAQSAPPPNNGFTSAGIQNINNAPKKKKHGCLWSIITFFLICALFSQCSNSDDDSATTSDNDTSISSEATAAPKTKTDKKKTSKKSKNTPKPKKSAKVKKASFIKACKKYNYKKVMRNPDEYIGKKIKIKCQIKQISEDGLFTQGFLRCCSYSGYGLYGGDEYLVFDTRASKSPKLLTNDVITIYGTIEEPQEMKRALTGTKDTVFTINMKYVKISDE